MKKGIAIAGNLIADIVKFIDEYPGRGMLTNVRGKSLGVGGACANTGCDLAALDPSIKIYAYGRVGGDDYGRFVTDTLANYGINTDGVIITNGADTSYTDVMTEINGGGRTFFHAGGANALFVPEDIHLDPDKIYMLHIGYALLLDGFDASDAEYGTVMARFLRGVQAAGIKTSIDVVSEQGERFDKIVPPALKYCDNVILNEIEAGMVANIEPRRADGSIIIENLNGIARALLDRGVRDCVYIHCPECGFAMDAAGEHELVPSLDLPDGYIKGGVGAGDAFCSGILYGIYTCMCMREKLELAAACAACNLSVPDSVSGARSLNETLKLNRMYAKLNSQFNKRSRP